MTGPFAYGIDFGTTNSSIAAIKDSLITVLETDPDNEPAEALRSITFFHRDGDRDAGRTAARRYLLTAPMRTRCGQCDRVEYLPDGPSTNCRQFRPGGGCHDARLIGGIKPLLTDASFDETSSWGEVFRAEDLAGVVFWKLKRLADDYFEADVPRVVVGHPVHFLTDSDGELAFERLRRAAQVSGFKEVAFYPEPAAAIASDPQEFAGKTVCSVDFGGGTFDVAIIRFDRTDEGSGELLGLSGVDVGGEKFDGLLFARFVAPLLGVNSPVQLKSGETKPLPAYIRAGLESLNDTARLAADPAVFTTLKHYLHQAVRPDEVEPAEDLIFGGQAFDFWSTLEASKRALSQQEAASFVYRRGRVDVETQITRLEFEALISPHLAEVKACIDEALDIASLDTDAVDLVIRTGGSSLLPAFNAILDEMFGAGRVESRPAFASVAAGLAEVGPEMEWEGD